MRYVLVLILSVFSTYAVSAEMYGCQSSGATGFHRVGHGWEKTTFQPEHFVLKINQNKATTRGEENFEVEFTCKKTNGYKSGIECRINNGNGFLMIFDTRTLHGAQSYIGGILNTGNNAILSISEFTCQKF